MSFAKNVISTVPPRKENVLSHITNNMGLLKYEETYLVWTPRCLKGMLKSANINLVVKEHHWKSSRKRTNVSHGAIIEHYLNTTFVEKDDCIIINPKVLLLSRQKVNE
jgi:hypothetical protein